MILAGKKFSICVAACLKDHVLNAAQKYEFHWAMTSFHLASTLLTQRNFL